MNEIFGKQAHVRRLLRTAFADVRCPYEDLACGPMLHEESVELRRDFYNLTPEQIQYDLRYILEDVMDTRTGDDIETEDVEYLFLQLDPMGSDDAVIRRIRLNQFENFTKEQAQAVYDWLQLARVWPEMKRFTKWIDAAIDYWYRRANER